MSTSVNAQTNAIVAKDVLIAALTCDSEAIRTSDDPAKAAVEIAAAFEVILKNVREIT